MLKIFSDFTVYNINGASRGLINALNKIKLELDENYINGYICIDDLVQLDLGDKHINKLIKFAEEEQINCVCIQGVHY
jgi:hypothetical protein